MVIEVRQRKHASKTDRRREERFRSLAVEQAEAAFENPARARELAAAILNEAGVPVPSSGAPLGPAARDQPHVSEYKVSTELQAKIEKLEKVTDLAVEAFEIVNGELGNRLMASGEGKRVLEIAKQVLALKGKLSVL